MWVENMSSQLWRVQEPDISQSKKDNWNLLQIETRFQDPVHIENPAISATTNQNHFQDLKQQDIDLIHFIYISLKNHF